MPNPALLLFDLGGVLTQNDAFHRLKTLLNSPDDRDTLKERWLQSPAVRGFELGSLSAERFAADFTDEWQLPLSTEAFLDEFVSWPKGFYPGVRDTLQQLRNRYRIACLSNSNPLHWQRFGGFSDDFDHTFFSHLLGVIKPDPQAFELALAHCQVEAEAVYFFDDCHSNVDAAQQLGMQAFQVDGFSALQQQLQALGLLPPTAALD